MKVFLNESGCLLLDHSEFKNFSIHPLWLRERLNSEKYLFAFLIFRDAACLL